MQANTEAPPHVIYIYYAVSFRPEEPKKTWYRPTMVSLEQIIQLVGPFVMGLLVGALVKRIVSVAVVLVALFIILVALGYMSPQQVAQILQQIGYSAKDAVATAMNLRNAIPYSSLAFLIGLAIGLWKG
jgi:uncharacterized membrane protein (Fun14 family)